jgi:MFS family permease
MDNVKLVAISSAIRGLGFSSIWIYSSIYMYGILGVPTFFISLVFMVGGTISSFAMYAGGKLGDIMGHKLVYSLFLLVISAVSLLYSFDRNVIVSAVFYPVVFGIILILNGMQSPSSNALVSRSSNVQLKGFSILRVGGNLGWGLGPAIGGFLLSFYGFGYLFLFFTFTSFLSFLVSLLVREVAVKTPERKSNFRTSNLALILLSFSGMFLFMVQAQETISLSIYSNTIFSGTFYEIGIVYMTNGILVILTQPIFYKISSKIGEYSSLVIGGIVYTFGFFTYGFDFNLSQMIISTAILTMGENLAFPSGYSIVASISRKNRIGTNMGIYNAFISMGRATGPLLGGYFIPLVTNHVLFWFYVTFPGLISTVILLLAYNIIREYRKRFTLAEQAIAG